MMLALESKKNLLNKDTRFGYICRMEQIGGHMQFDELERIQNISNIY
jgi:hypothetical protein